MARPTLRQLEVFKSLLQTRSVSETARTLHITQPAVSKSLAQLEALVGLELFRRVRGRLVASASAEQISADVDRIFAQLDSLSGNITGLQHADAGQLTVAAVPAIASTLAGLCAGRFQASRPRSRLTLTARMSPEAVEDVVRHRADMAFIHGPPNDSDAKGVIVGESEFVCVMRRDHPMADMETLTAHDLESQPLVFLDEASPPSHLVRDKFAQANVMPNIVIETNMSFAARTAILENQAIAVIDSLFAMTDARSDIVVRRFRPRVPLQIYCVYSIHRELSPLAMGLIDEVRKCIAQDRSEAYLSVRP